MIITRTPFRVSLFGGGTDYPAWFREHGGTVLGGTINKYCYITCRYLPPFFEHRSRILYSKIETVPSNDRIEHPAARAILQHLGIEEGVEIHHDGDLPARAGLGSSSSFAVGLLHALRTLTHDMPDKMRLALDAIEIEQSVLKENVGCQDQVLTAFGGVNRVEFGQDGRIHVDPVPIGQERLDQLQDHLLLYFTGFSRIASVVAQEQIRRIPECKAELDRMREMAQEGARLLVHGDLTEIGRLLDEGWRLKRSLSSKVSTPAIDEVYAAARSAGALGGKLLGAGGGGFMLLFAKPEDQPMVRERLQKLMRIPFRFEHEGSRIILYQPEE